MLGWFDPLLLVLTTVVFGYGLYRRIRLWRLGRKEKRTDQPQKRLQSIWGEVLGQKRILMDAYPGWMDLMLFYGFMVPLMIIMVTQVYFTLPKAVTYHDSCYLGRANQIFEEPRRILRAIPALRLVEMDWNWIHSFCSGTGSGRMWMEEKTGTRINQMRTDQIIQTKAQYVGTACPDCLTMIGDGIKDKGLESCLTPFDLTELVLQTMDPHSLEDAGKERNCR